MQQSNGKLTGTAYAEHLRGCADLAIEIAARMNIHEDAARQATFATVIINAERHNVFMEPTPRDTKTPVIQPEPAAVKPATEKSVGEAAAEKDAIAAAKADEQIRDVPRVTTPEQADGAKRTALLIAIDAGRTALNKAGYTPIMTPKALNAIINDELRIKGNLGTLDTDQLESVVKMLSERLDTFKSNMKIFEPDF